MDIIGIFVGDETNEGLHAVHYDNEVMNEWERLMELWNDTEYVTDYCYKNQSFLSDPHFEKASIQDIIDKIRKEVEYLEEYLDDFTNGTFTNAKAENLQAIFLPLKNNQTTLPDLQMTKFKHTDRRSFRKPILRIYALRVGVNTFIITGGAIKLTKTMEGHPDTKKELEKINAVRKYLLYHNITDKEQLYCYESE